MGDLCFFDWDHDGEQDHVGIVVNNDPKKKILYTIEGNTSDTNHSNGGVVKECVRNYSVIMGVGRPAYPADPAPAAAPAAAAAAPTPPVAKAE